MSEAVGLLVGVRKDGKNAVVLLVRGGTEKSFPGACQVTVHGRLSSEERAMSGLEGYAAALRREVREELGPTIGRVVQDLIDQSEDALVLLHEQFENNKTIRTFGLRTDLAFEHFLEMAIPGDDVGGLRACTDPSVLEPLSAELHRRKGVPVGETRMFADEIEAVKLSFDVLFQPGSSKSSDDKETA